MFFKTEAHYSIYDPQTTKKQIKEHLAHEGITLGFNDLSDEWAAWAHYYAHHHLKLNNPVHEASYASIISGFMTGLPIGMGTDTQIQEETVDRDVLNKYNTLRQEGHTETEIRTQLIDYINTLYKDHISDYERKTKRVVSYITETEYGQFMSLPGKSKGERLEFLLTEYINNSKDKN